MAKRRRDQGIEPGIERIVGLQPETSGEGRAGVDPHLLAAHIQTQTGLKARSADDFKEDAVDWFLVNLTAIQHGRALEENEVLRLNYILKNRATKFIASGRKDDLYPENVLGHIDWAKLDDYWFLLPRLWRVKFTTGILMGTNDGRHFALPENQQLTTAIGRLLLTISPDGRNVVYSANQRLFLRAMQDPEAREISGSYFDTRNSFNPTPDGQELAFYTKADMTIKRIPVSGGAAVTVCQLEYAPTSMNWGQNGIVFLANQDDQPSFSQRRHSREPGEPGRG